MNTKNLEYIIAIAEEQSISRAAERFYLSHAALSRHVRNLEEELGTPLFIRSQEGVTLTPAGSILISDARAILHLEKELDAQLAAMRRQRKHMIRMMVDAPFFNRFHMLVLPRFHAEMPESSIDAVKCNTDQAMDALRGGKAGLALVMTAVPRLPDLVLLPFRTPEVHLYFPGGFTGSRDPEGLRAALDGGMFFSQYPAGSTMQALVAQQLSARNIFPQHVLEGESRTIIEHISQGRACSALPDSFSTNAQAAGAQRGERLFRLYYSIAYAAGSSPSPDVQRLMKIIIDVYGEEK